MSRSRSGEIERLSIVGRRNAPPLTPPSKGGKLRGTYAAGHHRSRDREFSTAQTEPPPTGRIATCPYL